MQYKEDLWERGRCALRADDEESAVELFTQLSNAGDWRGSYMVGYIFDAKGGQDKKHFIAAAHWYTRALSQADHHLPHYGLARYYYYGLGGAYDFASAYRHLQRCIDHKPIARLMMAELAFLGRGTPQDLGKAKELFLTAAKSGYPVAVLGLARVAKAEGRRLQTIIYAIRSMLMAIKLLSVDRNHSLLIGMGRRHGSFSRDRVPVELA